MKQLSHPKTLSIVLTIVSILLGIVLWAILGQFGMQNFPRVVLSLCLPPAIISLVAGVYLLIPR